MSPTTKDDEVFLRRALDLAKAGIGLTSPNPCVGAVVVSAAGEVLGQGTHTYDGQKHAEVLALEQAGTRARGATLYLNLEPCCHQGRTPPCVEAVIGAGISRVVDSMQDPNPLVAGNGFARLRAAGIVVEVGGLESEARKLNEAFACYILHQRPFVTLKTAMTLDGKIAPPPGTARTESNRWITGEAARAHVQELRHASDAILTGVGTVLADDPLLTDRTGKARRRRLLRVVLDSHLRLPLTSRLVQTAQQDVLVFCTGADEEKKKRLEGLGILVERAGAKDSSEPPDWRHVLGRLGEMKITSVMIEGGAQVNGSALGAGAVDKVFLFYYPQLLGGNAVPFASSSRHALPALALKHVSLHRFAADFAVEGYFID